jgi:hypothetical protein
MYTREQIESAVAEAVRRERTAAEGRKAVVWEDGRKKGFAEGFSGGEQAALAKVAAQAAAAGADVQARLRGSVSNFVFRASVASLLGTSTLREDKAMAMQAWQFLDLVTARLTDLGYAVRMALPMDKMPMLRQYETARVYLSVPEGFRATFVNQFESMTLLDALGLVNRLYGFGLWVAAEEPVVWMGYYSAEPKPTINAPVEVRFDESRFADIGSRAIEERRLTPSIPAPPTRD